MEITGKIILALPEVTGVSKAGNNWKKREYVLETQDNYPKKVHFDLFGDRADQYHINVGDTIKLSYDIESREYNGRWYTSIHGWKVESAADGATAAAAAAPAAADPFAGMPAAAPEISTQASEDDLPF